MAGDDADCWLGAHLRLCWLGHSDGSLMWLAVMLTVGHGLACAVTQTAFMWLPPVYGFGMDLGSLSANIQCYVPVLLKDRQRASDTGACWPLGRAWS